MKNIKKQTIYLILVLIIQTVIFCIIGANKSYIHMDEAYSLGLASYDKVEIQDNNDFYNNWHNKEYYEDYLSVQEDEKGQFKQVYENQKNDVHPPLYYLLLRLSMGFNLNQFSKWPGIILNIIIYMFITIFTYLIMRQILDKQENAVKKAIILAFISSITMASLTNVIYIRMYALATLNILITTYLHIKLIKTKNNNYKLLSLIGISALFGVLTHYYYLFYLSGLYLVFVIKYIKNKEWKKIINYTTSLGIAGIISLIIFPYSIQHMFFGYRGQGVISNLTNIPKFIESIGLYTLKVNRFVFNNMLFPILIMMLIIIIYKLIKKQKINQEKNEYTKILLIPTIVYFTIVSVASPWIELRYIMPVCSTIFILTIYYLYNMMNHKKKDIIILTLLSTILIAPLIFKIEPEVLYSDKKEIVNKLENELNIPTIYAFNSNNNRFLDDILLFSLLNESYIAKDIEYTEDNIKSILEEKDISKGIILFINEGQENDNIIENIQNVTNLTECIYLKRLNACDLYYLK